VVDSVGEIETGISSRELERRFRPDWCHPLCQLALLSLTIELNLTSYILRR
jgi:hypothetical protein